MIAFKSEMFGLINVLVYLRSKLEIISNATVIESLKHYGLNFGSFDISLKFDPGI